ncbi:hypothetical protein SOVF_089750 [Spinacia oleracea]|nr:hypothetical protein SOVF_089750 [Spinacia oleracea]
MESMLADLEEEHDKAICRMEFLEKEVRIYFFTSCICVLDRVPSLRKYCIDKNT